MSYGREILHISREGESQRLRRISLTQADEGLKYDEAYVEDLIWRHPETLPLEEIDASYSGLVPACTQLNTRVGILDVLFITPAGRIVIVEAKLWRNPEAKRKVVGQVLDYAAELSRWSYDDLEREVAKQHCNDRISLFRRINPDSDAESEAPFVDEVTRSLREGRFLLLICGDGIREDLVSITEFLEQYTTLDFTFGLIELAIYDAGNVERLVQPRVLAKSITLQKQTLTIEGGYSLQNTVEDTEGTEAPELTPRQELLLGFWTNLAKDIAFDEPTQESFNPSTKGDVYLRLPSRRAWITLYFYKATNTQGLFLTFNKGEPGDSLFRGLEIEKGQISSELPNAAVWKSKNGRHSIELSRPSPDIVTPEGQLNAKQWFQEHANTFVNALRPRLARIFEDL